ncbi:MAG TPA: IspD/TarI family cytidylyltransferase [Solirubrobacteraceae bacterium]|nr:IspD/TarI family cytidylyltransferase [Solirubrobacteraceae bacterium]
MAVALIVAAGRGERLGAPGPKALVELAGRPLLQWSVDALRAVPAIERIVVALPAGTQAPAGTIGVRGGAVRSESVRLALAATAAGASGGENPAVGEKPAAGESLAAAERSAAREGRDSELVLVHDAARPLLTAELVERVLAAFAEPGARVDAAIAATPVTDTVKRAGSDGLVRETLDRSELWAVQTPQVFRRGALQRALDVPDEILARATDDAWLLERAGGSVVVVQSFVENLKITTALDLALAELLLARRA